MIDDPYATGWERGYAQALVDVAAESHRLSTLLARIELERLLRALHAQLLRDVVA